MDGEGGGSGATFAVDLPVVLFADGAGNGETEAGAGFGFVGLVETIENLV